MIREIINFTDNLISDIPDIMQWNLNPSLGLHIIVEIDEDGNWKNKDCVLGKDFFINTKSFEGDNIPSAELIQYEQLSSRVGASMNKVLDKQKQIFSCSPFVISFKKKSITNEKLEGLGLDKLIRLLPEYFANAQSICLKNDEYLIQLSKSFQNISSEIYNHLSLKTIKKNIEDEKFVLDLIKDDEYINLYLKNATFEQYKKAHDLYVEKRLFNDDSYNFLVNDTLFGVSDFLNGLNSKKPFLEHKTSLNNICGRITSDDAKLLANFETLINNKVLPNPLPIILDKKELNTRIIKLFNNESDKFSYREILNILFAKDKINQLSNYYLINHKKRQGVEINDIDFVPLFRYYFSSEIIVENVCKSGIVKDKTFEVSPKIVIKDIFDFERIIVREIFNNSLVRIKDDKYSINYFNDIDPAYISGGDIMYQCIMTYRKSFYDYIYKSKTNALNERMFDDIMYKSILSSIKKDEIKYQFADNNNIKRKLNIWFSNYDFFSNNKNKENMASKVNELQTKMNKVAKGDIIFETPEEFAFGAGQIVSYLIDRSVANNKTYAMLEPYLQKNKSGQLQDAIAQTITVYKHDIKTCKGKFEKLSTNVLTYDDNIDFKPLLKYFLAGCFSPCEVYQKDEINN